jgi:arginyl-tRNA synthetase
MASTPASSSDPVSTLERAVRDALRAAAGDALPADLASGQTPVLTPARESKFGDFQCNAAMALAKSLGKPPRDVAAQIKASLDALAADVIEPVEIAGPGFINIRLKPAALAGALAAIDTPALGIDAPAHPETVVVDLCGVNLAKQMHVGHLRATVIGDALARLHERLGFNVVRQNHFGDWGLPIAMVTALVQHGIDAGTVNLEALTLDGLEKLYRQAQKNCEADEAGLAAVKRFGLGPKAEAELEAQVSGAREHMEHAKKSLVALQAHDAAALRVWERISAITLAACFEACRRLFASVTADATAGESTYAHDLPEVVADLVSRGVAEESDGALVVRLDEVGIKEPCIIRKRDGGFLYATTDMAAIRRRVQKIGASRVIYAVDARQGLHFKQVFAAAHKAGYTARKAGAPATLTHAAFGTVLGEDNRPFKTRSGENVRLTDLLDEAVSRAEAAVAQKNPSLGADERRSVAEAVAASAIKYADLSSDRVKDYVFSFDRMLAFEGNTGPYLMYAYVRVRSIFRKAHEQLGLEESRFEGANAPAFSITAPEEKAVALALLRYPAAVRASADACEPHRLCGYLYELAGAFSAFFAACPVLQAPDDTTRLARLRLCHLTGRVIRDGLATLGLVAVERM